MKTHHRNYPFRPPRRHYPAGRMNLVRRFVRDYLAPVKWSVIGCVILVGLNGCSFYLMTYYTRTVVDRVLVVTPDAAVVPLAGGGSASGWNSDNRPARQQHPAVGAEHVMDQGTSLSRRPPGAARLLWMLFWLYSGSLVVLNMLSRLAQRIRIKVARRLTAGLREDLHRKVLDLSLSYHSRHTPGRLLSRITSDVEVVQDHLLVLILSAGRSIVVLLVGLAILLTANWIMGVVAISVMPLYAIIYARTADDIRRVQRETRHTNSCMYGLVSQKLDGAKVLQSYWRQGLERLHFHRLAAVFLRDALTQQRQSGVVNSAAQVVSSLTTGGLFLFGGRLVLQGQMTLGQMLYLYGIVAALFGPVLQLTMMSVGFNNLLVVIQRLVDILDAPLEIAEKPGAVPLPSPIRTEIVLDNVGFKYVSNVENEPILRAVSLRIKAGTWLCVTGPSGCGKSTLVYLMARLYEPSWGDIRIDGRSLSQFKVDSLRSRIGFVPQEPQIFSGTVRDNICYGVPHAEPQQIMAAAKAAEMHDFIMAMPVQYETLLGEKGISLSGGQRQRLSLARALLTDPDILILDDCTSALDAETERRIQDTLARILVGKTAIIVSQRASMARRCHRICTIENGIVSEFGSHDELAAKDGFYARLCVQQLGSE